MRPGWFDLRRKQQIYSDSLMHLKGKKREGEKCRSVRVPYLNTCISSGEFCSSSWRRCQRRQALSSCCSWASWGDSCLSHRHINTREQNSHCVGQTCPTEWLALFQCLPPCLGRLPAFSLLSTRKLLTVQRR